MQTSYVVASEMVVHVVFLVLILPTLIEAGGFNAFKFEQSGNIIVVDRFELGSYNKEYVQNISLVTFKYNRTCPAMNFTAVTTLELGNDMEIVVQVYKFLSNEYRMFPIHFQINTCDALQANAIGAKQVLKCGTFRGCPIKKNTLYHICNFAPDESKFPPLIPEGRFKVELTFMYHRIELAIVNGYATITRPLPIPV